ncbi:hypothetical protein SUDANB58_00453 [Streptomyces sp. enrichment culture]
MSIVATTIIRQEHRHGACGHHRRRHHGTAVADPVEKGGSAVEPAGGAAPAPGPAAPVAGPPPPAGRIGAFAHAGRGLPIGEGGYEFVLGAVAPLPAVAGAGRSRVGHLPTGRRRTARPVSD